MVDRSLNLGLGSATLGLDPWVVIPLVCVLVALLVALYLVRRSRAQEGDETQTERASLSRLALWQAWNRFARGLPGEARRGLLNIPHFIVLGDAGSGKSELIRRASGWEQKARQSYPSYTDDPNISFYYGSHAVVTEISPALLTDTSKASRAALRLLWRRLYRRHDPTFVITLNLSRPSSASADALTDHAEYIRGRIGLLARLRGHEIPTDVTLTFAGDPSTYPGFPALASVINDAGVKLYLDISQRRDRETIRSELDHYRPFISQVVAAQSVSDTPEPGLIAGAAHFFDKAHQPWVIPLTSFLRVLDEPDREIPRPAFGKIYFYDQKSPLVGHALEVTAAQLEALSAARVRRQRILAGLIVAVAGGLPLLASLTAGRRLGQAQDDIEQVSVSGDVKAVQDAAARLSSPQERVSAQAILARFTSPVSDTPQRQAALRADLADTLRDEFLVTELEGAIKKSSALDAVYSLGALYAPNDAQLEALVVDSTHAAKWQRHLRQTDPAVLQAYVEVSDAPWKALPSVAESRSLSWSTEAAVASQTRWMAWLLSLQSAVNSKQGFISADSLKALQAEGLALKAELSTAVDLELAARMVARLKALDDFGLEDHYPVTLNPPSYAQWLVRNEPSLRALVSLVEESNPPGGEIAQGSLKTLLTELEASSRELESSAQAGQTSPEVYKVDLGQTSVSINASQWAQVVGQGYYKETLADYGPRFDGTGDVFFATHTYPAQGLSNYQRGSILIPQFVDGRYSREALVKDVLPTLEAFSRALNQVPLGDAERRKSIEDLETELSSYALAYQRAWIGFLLSFQIRVSNSGELAGVMDRMALARSPLYEALELLAKNTQIDDLGEGVRWFDLISDQLALFQPINQLVQTAESSGDIRRAQALLKKMEADLASAEAAAPQAEAEAEDGGCGGWISQRRGEPTPAPEAGRSVTVDVESQKQSIADLKAELENLANRVDGVATTRLADYQTIVVDLRSVLRPQGFLDSVEQPDEEATQAELRFKGQLSPTGAVAFEALRATSGLTHHDERVEGWLEEVGVHEGLRAPFRALFQSVNALGRREISAVVERNWEDVVFVQVQDYLQLYPFKGSHLSLSPDRNLAEVGPLQLEGTLIPGSGFWADVDALIMPVLREDDALRLEPREVSGVPLRVSAAMLQTLRHLAIIREALWTQDGERRALCMDVIPRPLPHAGPGGSVATLSVLTLGPSSVFGFNQRASTPQSFEIPWWDQSEANVGVQLTAPTGQNDERDLQEDNLSIPQSRWALFRLMDRAAMTQLSRDKAALRWDLQAPVTFLIGRDPRRLFVSGVDHAGDPLDLRCRTTGDAKGEAETGDAAK